MNTYYFFLDHLGSGVYWTTDSSYVPETCEQCGDSDEFIIKIEFASDDEANQYKAQLNERFL